MLNVMEKHMNTESPAGTGPSDSLKSFAFDDPNHGFDAGILNREVDEVKPEEISDGNE